MHEQLDLLEYIESLPDREPEVKSDPLTDLTKRLQITKFGGYRQNDGTWISLYSGKPEVVPDA